MEEEKKPRGHNLRGSDGDRWLKGKSRNPAKAAFKNSIQSKMSPDEAADIVIST